MTDPLPSHIAEQGRELVPAACRPCQTERLYLVRVLLVSEPRAGSRLCRPLSQWPLAVQGEPPAYPAHPAAQSSARLPCNDQISNPQDPVPLDSEDRSSVGRLDLLIYLNKCDHSRSEARQEHRQYRRHPLTHHNAEDLLRSALRLWPALLRGRPSVLPSEGPCPLHHQGSDEEHLSIHSQGLFHIENTRDRTLRLPWRACRDHRRVPLPLQAVYLS